MGLHFGKENASEECLLLDVVCIRYPITKDCLRGSVIVHGPHDILEGRDLNVELLTKARFESDLNQFHRITELLGLDAKRVESLVVG
jgi:hypothetical protein